MSDYRPTIGLEVHAELKTRTKMFCASKNDPDEKRPNVNVCPVCLAHPGTLPVINKEAVRHVLRMGAAIGGTLADYTEWDRKSYFYPDLPKGYQISQYEHPLVSGGTLAGVAITRIHLEEDTARSQHPSTTSSQGSDGYGAGSGSSLVDFNRAGVPLMELVTEPVVHSAEQAGAFARELQLLLRTLGAGEANMEKGEMRVEANISISKDEKFGTKVEVKNINSFRAVERAITYELKRQEEVLERGEKVVQETRGWDDAKQETFSQRLKESSHDYRYFPDPDLPSLRLSEIPEFSSETIRASLPELPWQRRGRYMQEMKMKAEDAELFVSDSAFSTLLEGEVLPAFGSDEKLRTLAVNYLTSDVRSYAKENPEAVARVTPGFVELMRMVGAGELSSRSAKDLLEIMAGEGGDPRTLAQEHGLFQSKDTGVLETIVKEVLSANAAVAAEYKAGKTTALQFLIGQAMKASKGSGNPSIFKEIFEKELKA